MEMIGFKLSKPQRKMNFLKKLIAILLVCCCCFIQESRAETFNNVLKYECSLNYGNGLQKQIIDLSKELYTCISFSDDVKDYIKHYDNLSEDKKNVYQIYSYFQNNPENLTIIYRTTGLIQYLLYKKFSEQTSSCGDKVNAKRLGSYDKCLYCVGSSECYKQSGQLFTEVSELYPIPKPGTEKRSSLNTANSSTSSIQVKQGLLLTKLKNRILMNSKNSLEIIKLLSLIIALVCSCFIQESNADTFNDVLQNKCSVSYGENFDRQISDFSFLQYTCYFYNENIEDYIKNFSSQSEEKQNAYNAYIYFKKNTENLYLQYYSTTLTQHLLYKKFSEQTSTCGDKFVASKLSSYDKCFFCQGNKVCDRKKKQINVDLDKTFTLINQCSVNYGKNLDDQITAFTGLQYKCIYYYEYIEDFINNFDQLSEQKKDAYNVYSYFQKNPDNLKLEYSYTGLAQYLLYKKYSELTSSCGDKTTAKRLGPYDKCFYCQGATLCEKIDNQINSQLEINKILLKKEGKLQKFLQKLEVTLNNEKVQLLGGSSREEMESQEFQYQNDLTIPKKKKKYSKYNQLNKLPKEVFKRKQIEDEICKELISQGDQLIEQLCEKYYQTQNIKNLNSQQLEQQQQQQQSQFQQLQKINNNLTFSQQDINEPLQIINEDYQQNSQFNQNNCNFIGEIISQKYEESQTLSEQAQQPQQFQIDQPQIQNQKAERNIDESSLKLLMSIFKIGDHINSGGEADIYAHPELTDIAYRIICINDSDLEQQLQELINIKQFYGTLMYEYKHLVVEGIANSIIMCQNLTHISLDLKNKDIGSEQACFLANALLECQKITSLNLYLNQFTINDEAFQSVSQALGYCPNISDLTLYFNKNRISSQGVQLFAQSLQKLQSINKLYLKLEDNYIGSNGIQIISNSLENCQNIKQLELYLEGNKISSEQAEKLQKSLNGNQNIKLMLKLEEQENNDIAKNIRNNNEYLEEKKFPVFLNKKIIKLEIIQNLIKSLKDFQNFPIQKLNIRLHQDYSEGENEDLSDYYLGLNTNSNDELEYQFINQIFVKGKALTELYLDLQMAFFFEQYNLYVAEVLTKYRDVNYLNIEINEMTKPFDKGALKIIEMLKKYPKLTHLSLSFNQKPQRYFYKYQIANYISKDIDDNISKLVAESISNTLTEHLNLQQLILKLNQNSIGSQGANYIGQALIDLKNLENLSLGL
ncbi:hypothetical protein ABPG73_022664, partial [Tetrahymena malaccensis]